MTLRLPIAPDLASSMPYHMLRSVSRASQVSMMRADTTVHTLTTNFFHRCTALVCFCRRRCMRLSRYKQIGLDTFHDGVREADLIELDSAPHGFGEAHSKGPHLPGQPPCLPLKVLGYVLGRRLQLLFIELLGHWLGIILNLHPA